MSESHPADAAAAAATSRQQHAPILPQPLSDTDVKKNPYAQYGMFPSSTLVELQAILQVLLAGGNLPRAKALWERMQKTLHKHQQSRDEDWADHLHPSEQAMEAKLKDIVPMHTHASFIRAFFRAALGLREQQQQSQMVSSSSSSAELEEDEGGAKAVRDRQRQRRNLVKQAWGWWTMLNTKSIDYGLPDSHVVAALLKGSIQCVSLLSFAREREHFVD